MMMMMMMMMMNFSRQARFSDALGKVEKEAAPGFTFAGFARCFSWRHFKPTKMIAGDVHLRRHQDRKFGKFLLQLLMLWDFDGSGRKTCKDDDDDDDDESRSGIP